MRQQTYLNGILTVNALLLAALVWTQVAERPVFADGAIAGPTPQGVLDAGAQRARTIAAIERLENVMDQSMRDLKRSMDTTRDVLKSGQAQVNVVNIADLSRETPSERRKRLAEAMRRR